MTAPEPITGMIIDTDEHGAYLLITGDLTEEHGVSIKARAGHIPAIAHALALLDAEQDRFTAASN